MLNNAFENTMVALIGFAGTGKYTIGRELCERTGATLVHNHLINNPIFNVVKVDATTPLPPQVWDLVKEVRATVYEAIRELSAPERSFVFTMHLRQSSTADKTDSPASPAGEAKLTTACWERVIEKEILQS